MPPRSILLPLPVRGRDTHSLPSAHDLLSTSRADAVGFVNGRFIHDMHGRAIGQLNGTHVHRLRGQYVGELDNQMVVDKHLGNLGNIGNPGNPGNPGSPGNPASRGNSGYTGHADVFHKLLEE